MLTAGLLLPLTFGNTVQARICVTPDSPFGNAIKGIMNSSMIKNAIQRKIAENPGNKTFLKVVSQASQNVTSMLCKPGEEATIFNASAPPYFPTSAKTVNSASPVSNSTLAEDSISFKTTVQPPLNPGIFIEFSIPEKSNFNFGPGSPLCPTNNCKQGFIDATYAPSTEVPMMWGTLKIENKTTSTPQTINII